MTDHVETRTGIYRDSVALLQVSKRVSEVDGITSAIIAMATPLNLELAADLGFDDLQAGPNDLMVVLRGVDDSAIDAGVSALATELAAEPVRSTSEHLAIPAHTVATGLQRQPDTNLVLLSVPGESVLAEANDAIEAGRTVLIFSDNVSVEHEILLKSKALDAGVLVMGPDCGTAIIGGVALGFANVVRRGNIGIVAASGTGAQQVSCLLDWAGLGVSHLIGVGGRDLSDAVDGIATSQALRALAADDSTDQIIVVSKPPHPRVATQLEALAADLSAQSGKTITFCLLGPGRPDMTDIVEQIAGGGQRWQRAGVSPRTAAGPCLRGIFSGGTLADEAMVVAGALLGPIQSNIPLSPDLRLNADLTTTGHAIIDFGDDALTRGRAHPMIDPTLRLERIARESADPACGVLLVDVVLGYVADQDPALALGPALQAARSGRDLPVIISLTGTAADPQSWHRQAEAFAAAGAEVYLSNAAAARRAAELIGAGR